MAAGACAPLPFPPDMPDPGGDTAGGEDASDGSSGDDGTSGGPDDGGSDTLGGSVDDDVPDLEYCAPVADWSADDAAFEEQVLALVNEQRAAGADCGSGGVFAPAEPLSMNAALRCAARLHSQDMAARGFFDHTNPDSEGPGERIAPTGYEPRTWGENIAFGYATPEDVVAGWMSSDGHCSNIMRTSFTEMGVGYHLSRHWTQVFGAR